MTNRVMALLGRIFEAIDQNPDIEIDPRVLELLREIEQIIFKK